MNKKDEVASHSSVCSPCQVGREFPMSRQLPKVKKHDVDVVLVNFISLSPKNLQILPAR